MKTVVIISTMRFVDNISAGVSRTSNYANMLNDNNIEVIFASLNEYDFDAELHAMDCFPKRKILYSKTALKDNVKFRNQLTKVKHYFQTLHQIGRKEDLVFLLYPSKDTIFDLLVLHYLKRKHDFSVFYELNEIRKYSYALTTPKGIIKYFINCLNEGFFHRYNGVLCISTNIQKFIIQKNPKNILIPILLDAEQANQIEPQFHSENIFRIGFAGTIGIRKEHPDTFLQALSILINEGVHNIEFNLFGSFSKRELKRLNRSIQNYKLEEYVYFRGAFKQNELRHKLQEQHLLVLPRKQTKQNKYGFSTKLSDYLLTCIPVLLTDVSDNLLYIQDGFNGIIAHPDHPESYAEKILYLMKNYNTIAPQLGKNAFITSKENFDYRKHADTVVRFLFGNNI